MKLKKIMEKFREINTSNQKINVIFNAKISWRVTEKYTLSPFNDSHQCILAILILIF